MAVTLLILGAFFFLSVHMKLGLVQAPLYSLVYGGDGWFH